MLTWAAAVYLTHSLLMLAKLGHRRPSAAVSTAERMTLNANPRAQAVLPGLEAEDIAPTAVLEVSARHEVALSLAFQGFGLADIARRCDITVAEAKLVATLAESYRNLAHTTGVTDVGRARAAA